jgi:DNA-directed RNA polymerase subunit RPC12/RpoP
MFWCANCEQFNLKFRDIRYGLNTKFGYKSGIECDHCGTSFNYTRDYRGSNYEPADPYEKGAIAWKIEGVTPKGQPRLQPYLLTDCVFCHQEHYLPLYGKHIMYKECDCQQYAPEDPIVIEDTKDPAPPQPQAQAQPQAQPPAQPQPQPAPAQARALAQEQPAPAAVVKEKHVVRYVYVCLRCRRNAVLDERTDEPLTCPWCSRERLVMLPAKEEPALTGRCEECDKPIRPELRICPECVLACAMANEDKHKQRQIRTLTETAKKEKPPLRPHDEKPRELSLFPEIEAATPKKAGKNGGRKPKAEKGQAPGKRKKSEYRGPKGAEHVREVLPDILKLLKDGKRIADISRATGVSDTTIGKIKKDPEKWAARLNDNGGNGNGRRVHIVDST